MCCHDPQSICFYVAQIFCLSLWGFKTYRCYIVHAQFCPQSHELWTFMAIVSMVHHKLESRMCGFRSLMYDRWFDTESKTCCTIYWPSTGKCNILVPTYMWCMSVYALLIGKYNISKHYWLFSFLESLFFSLEPYWSLNRSFQINSVLRKFDSASPNHTIAT